MTEIRKATQDDTAALYNMREAEDGYYERCVAERHVFIAPDAGFVMLNEKPLYSAYRKLNIPEIQDLYVLPQARGKGVGRHLVEYCEDEASALGYETVGISVGLHGGFGAAQRLYVRLGYIPDGNGVTYDREPVKEGERCAIDDGLALMMVKEL